MGFKKANGFEQCNDITVGIGRSEWELPAGKDWVTTIGLQMQICGNRANILRFRMVGTFIPLKGHCESSLKCNCSEI